MTFHAEHPVIPAEPLDPRDPEQSTGTAHTAQKGRNRPQVGIMVALTALVIVAFFPYLFMLLTSFKSKEQFAEQYWLPAWPLALDNYGKAFEQVAPYLFMTFLVAAVSVVAIIFLSLLSGYVLARFTFPGRQFFFLMVVALLMVPNIAALIPRFALARDLGMLNTFPVLVIPYVAGGLVLGTVLMKTFIEGIPQELFDAARVDGAGQGRLFFSIMLPLSFPVIGTVALINLIAIWNDFFWPLLTITENSLKTISVGLLFFQGQSGTDFGAMFAGYMLASLPLLLLFTFFSRYFLAGVQGGLPGSH
ncbi:carbohydrate ABC transporter permease [Jiangella endophytica]|uniref:carbohydrate ABC transporter permease n=1 Tax=Jiangella endophytica TaxID=1623398 RepID=UPI0018E5A368|nr:carbohydrate ABC transporter permease [Jiangella endophytica]